MSEIRRIYEEIMADLKSKGFGGYVDQLNDYKNVGDTTSIIGLPKKDIPTSNTTPNKNESPASCILLDSGALKSSEVA